MKITVDATAHLAVVVCSCGWRDAATDRAGAYRAGMVHAQRCHDDKRAAERARWSALRAAKSAGVRTQT